MNTIILGINITKLLYKLKNFYEKTNKKDLGAML